MQGEVWPNEMPMVPMVGNRIRSAKTWSNGFQLNLEVCSITWVYIEQFNSHNESWDHGWIPEIELHIPKSYDWSIKDFYVFYARNVGKSVSYFI